MGEISFMLSHRQRKFMELAAREDGVCPYDQPKGSPVLTNNEIEPLIAAHLIASPKDETDIVWFTTLKGDRVLAEIASAHTTQKSRGVR